jgi:hypothetical protein
LSYGLTPFPRRARGRRLSDDGLNPHDPFLDAHRFPATGGTRGRKPVWRLCDGRNQCPEDNG